MKYVPHYSGRDRKAKKILSILHHFAGLDLSDRICLDIGCSAGEISENMAAEFKMTVGMDIDQQAIERWNRPRGTKKLYYFLANGYNIPIPHDTIDIAICAQVYEHVLDQPALAKEIWRVLRPGGICFFSGPNRFTIMEEHYWLPFLSWLPGPFSNLYMRAFKRGNRYDVYPLSYWQLRKLWAGFIIYDYTINLLREPRKYAIEDQVKIQWLGKIPVGLLQAFTPLFPNYNWLLVKPA